VFLRIRIAKRESGRAARSLPPSPLLPEKSLEPRSLSSRRATGARQPSSIVSPFADDAIEKSELAEQWDAADDKAEVLGPSPATLRLPLALGSRVTATESPSPRDDDGGGGGEDEGGEHEDADREGEDDRDWRRARTTRLLASRAADGSRCRRSCPSLTRTKLQLRTDSVSVSRVASFSPTSSRCSPSKALPHGTIGPPPPPIATTAVGDGGGCCSCGCETSASPSASASDSSSSGSDRHEPSHDGLVRVDRKLCEDNVDDAARRNNRVAGRRGARRPPRSSPSRPTSSLAAPISLLMKRRPVGTAPWLLESTLWP
jgi:hypothetical protein